MMFDLEILTLVLPKGFHSELGEVNLNCPLKQGARGPRLFPGIQVFDEAHHPQLPDFIQTSG